MIVHDNMFLILVIEIAWERKALEKVNRRDVSHHEIIINISANNDTKQYFVKYEYNIPLPPSAKKVEILKYGDIQSNL